MFKKMEKYNLSEFPSTNSNEFSSAKNKEIEEDNKNRNENGKYKRHSFNVEDAVRFGIPKAIILYNLRFWLEENKSKNINILKHTDDKYYVWTWNPSRVFAKKYPYIPEKSISRYLLEMKENNQIIVNRFNKFKYDRTNWYTIPNLYEITDPEKIKRSVDESNVPFDYHSTKHEIDN